MFRFHDQKLLMLIGYSGSGKSYIARSLQLTGTRRIIEFGSIVRESMKNCLNCNNAVDHADHVYQSGNKTQFAKLIHSSITEAENQIVLVGARKSEEICYVRKQFNSVIAVGLDVPYEIRSNRLMCIKPADWTMNEAKLFIAKREKLECTWGMEDALESCDFVIDGNRESKRIVDEINTILGCRSQS